jgi:hypothetical protein
MSFSSRKMIIVNGEMREKIESRAMKTRKQKENNKNEKKNFCNIKFLAF